MSKPISLDPAFCSKNLQLSNSNKTVTVKSGTKIYLALGDRVLADNDRFSVRVDTVPDGIFMIGVASPTVVIHEGNWSSDKWYFNPAQPGKCGNGSSESYGVKVENGAVIECILKGTTLEFVINSKNYGPAFTNVQRPVKAMLGTWCSDSKKCQMTLLPPSSAASAAAAPASAPAASLKVETKASSVVFGTLLLDPNRCSKNFILSSDNRTMTVREGSQIYYVLSQRDLAPHEKFTVKVDTVPDGIFMVGVAKPNIVVDAPGSKWDEGVWYFNPAMPGKIANSKSSASYGTKVTRDGAIIECELKGDTLSFSVDGVSQGVLCSNVERPVRAMLGTWCSDKKKCSMTLISNQLASLPAGTASTATAVSASTPAFVRGQPPPQSPTPARAASAAPPLPPPRQQQAEAKALSVSNSAAPASAAPAVSKSSAASAASTAASPRAAKERELAALFERLDLSDYLPVFVSEEAFVKDIPKLKEAVIEKLIPKAGPRSRLLDWVESQRSAPPGGPELKLDVATPGTAGSGLSSPTSPPASSSLSSNAFSLVDLKDDSDEFFELEDKFKASLNGHLECYVKERIEAKQRPITFKLVAAQRIENATLSAQFEKAKERIRAAILASGGDVGQQLKVARGFHGTHKKNIGKIAASGLLRVGHPNNPSSSVDEGWFGSPKHGVYLSQHPDYCLQYSNGLEPLRPGDEAKLLMFDVLPGRSKHIAKASPGMLPTPGFDSHRSANFVEWFLFSEDQCVPRFVLQVRAIEDRRVKTNDDVHDSDGSSALG